MFSLPITPTKAPDLPRPGASPVGREGGGEAQLGQRYATWYLSGA